MYFKPQFQTATTKTPAPPNPPGGEADNALVSQNAPTGKTEDIQLRFPTWRRSTFYL